MEKHKVFYFRACHSFGTLKAVVSLQLNGMLMMCKIQQAMQDDAIWTARIHPGNRDEVFIWQNFQPAYRDLGWKKSVLFNQEPIFVSTLSLFSMLLGDVYYVIKTLCFRYNFHSVKQRPFGCWTFLEHVLLKIVRLLTG